MKNLKLSSEYHVRRHDSLVIIQCNGEKPMILSSSYHVIIYGSLVKDVSLDLDALSCISRRGFLNLLLPSVSLSDSPPDKYISKGQGNC